MRIVCVVCVCVCEYFSDIYLWKHAYYTFNVLPAWDSIVLLHLHSRNVLFMRPSFWSTFCTYTQKKIYSQSVSLSISFSFSLSFSLSHFLCVWVCLYVWIIFSHRRCTFHSISHFDRLKYILEPFEFNWFEYFFSFFAWLRIFPNTQYQPNCFRLLYV